MNNFEQTLYQILVSLGIDFEKFKADKEERIKAHKYCYLLSKYFRLDIEGAFSLYINGPYNYHVTDTLYAIAKEKNKNFNKLPILPAVQDVVTRIKEVFPNAEDTRRQMEIFTTYDFIKTHYPSMPENWINMLRKEKGHIINQNLDDEELSGRLQELSNRLALA